MSGVPVRSRPPVSFRPFSSDGSVGAGCPAPSFLSGGVAGFGASWSASGRVLRLGA